MQLDAEIAVVADPVRYAHAEGLGAKPVAFRVVAVEDHHVAVLPAVALEEPARGRTGARRRDDLEKAGADRKQHVREAVLRDVRVAMADFQAENRCDARSFALDVHGDEADLPQAQERRRAQSLARSSAPPSTGSATPVMNLA